MTGRPTDEREVRIDRAILEYLEAMDTGRDFDREEFLDRHLDVAGELEDYLADHEQLGRLTAPLRQAAPLGQEIPRELDDLPGEDSLPGRIGGYRPVRFLGAGGMGRVYEAEDQSGRRVALKLIAPRFAGSPTALERFRQEGRLAALIAHPRCVFVLEADEESGQPYIAMELMEGETLKNLIDRTGPLEPTAAVAKILDVIEGLEQAHDLGVIHRDVKPANCYLDGEGRVKVGDFGLSRSLTSGLALTQVGGFVGTPLFASPEQIKGERLDARADVYAVAATLYYLLVGRAPFGDSDGNAAVARIASEDPPSLRRLRAAIPAALDRVVLKGLERARMRRFATLDELRSALSPFVPHELTFASLGLRLGALWIDVLPFWLIAVLMSFSATRIDDAPNLYRLLIIQIPLFLYFWFFDGIWGRTLGKHVLRLRVVPEARGFGAPGLQLAFARTAVFIATSGILTDLTLYATVAPTSRLRWSLFGLTGYAIGFALRFSTMRASNGYRGLHEIVSGTRVVRYPRTRRRDWLDAQVTLGPPLSTAHPQGLPDRLGGYVIRGAVRWDDRERILAGDDPALGRQVWIRLLSDGRKPLSSSRRGVSRPTRLRWLTAVDHGPLVWEAVVAPTGRPIKDWAAHGELGWGLTRRLLEQLTDECIAARDESTLPATLTLDQIWVRPSGQLQLLDFALKDDCGAGERGAAKSGEEQCLGLLERVATVCLDRAEKAESGALRGILAVVPLHARRLLDRLAGKDRPFGDLSECRTELAAVHDRPSEVTIGHRALQISVSCLLSSSLVLVLLWWSRIPGVAAVVANDRTMTRTRALLVVLDDETLRLPFCAELPAESPLCRDVAETRRRLIRRYELDRLDLSARIRALGPLGQLRALRQILHENKPLSLKRVPWLPSVIRLPMTDGPIAYDVFLGPRDVSGLLEHASRFDSEQYRSAWAFAWAVSCLPLSIIVLIAALTRGGAAFRLVGLALVRADGRDASRLRAAWRGVLAILPFVLLEGLVCWIDLGPTNTLGLWPVPFSLATLTLLVHIGLALTFPQRTPHDWLAGTYVVPR
jgi:eukaryotic-like serine/threonine-protein kinase